MRGRWEKSGSAGSSVPTPEESSEVLRRLLLQAGQIGVDAPEKMWPDGGGRLARAEAAYAGFLEKVVAGKNLVGAFARQDNLQPRFAHQPGQPVERRGRGAQDRLLGMAHDVREDGGYAVRVAADCVVLGAERCGHRGLPVALVEFRIVEGDGEGAQTARSQPRSERGDRRGIQPSRQEGADLDIGAQANARRVFQKGEHFLGDRGFGTPVGSLIGIREVERPVAPGTRLAILDHHDMRGRQFGNAPDYGAGRNRRPQREDLVESQRVDFRLDARHLQQRLHSEAK
jgi:hypothetical protein